MSEAGSIDDAIDAGRYDEVIRSLHAMTRRGLWGEALGAATAVLGREPAPSLPVRRHVWEWTLLGPDSVAWRAARAAVRAGDAALASMGQRLDERLRGFAAREFGPGAARLLEGFRHAARAASDGQRGGDRGESFDLACGAYQDTFGAIGDNEIGARSADLAVRWLLDLPRRVVSRAETGLVSEAGTQSAVIGLVAELVEGDPPGLVPDPIALGFSDLDPSFLKAVGHAWNFVGRRDPCLAGRQVIWGFSGPIDQHRLGGGSGGAAFAAVFRAALRGVHLDPDTIISATLGPDGRLGPVISAETKRRAACEPARPRSQVLFERTTANGVARPDDLPKVIGVETFDSEPGRYDGAWDLLTARAQALDAFLGCEREDIRDGLKYLPAEEEDPFNLYNVLVVVEDVPLLKDRRPKTDERRRGLMVTRLPIGVAEIQEKYRPAWPPGRPGDESPGRPFDDAMRGWIEGSRRTLILLGEAGRGKSWQLARLAWQMLDRLRDARTGPLPLRATCAELAGRLREQPGASLGQLIREVVVARLKKEKGERAAAILDGLIGERIERGEAILLIDAWDEQPATEPGEDSMRQTFYAWARGSRTRVMLSSRRDGGDVELLPEPVKWSIRPLDEPAAHDFTARYARTPEAGARLWAELDRRPRLKSLVATPLYGALVCLAWGSDDDPTKSGRLPGTWTAILEGAVRAQLSHCRPARGGAPILSESADPAFVDEVFEVLSRLAFETYCGGDWAVQESELIAALGRAVVPSPDLGTAREIVKALKGRFGILSEQYDGKLHATHPSVAEILAARAVVKEFKRDPAAFASRIAAGSWPKLLDPEYREVWVHAVAFGSERPELDQAGGTAPARASILTSLLEVLWAMHRRARRWWFPVGRGPRDDVFQHGLCLAAHCMAAAGWGWETPIGRKVVKALLSLWRSTRSFDLLGEEEECDSRWADGSDFEEALVALGGAGCLDPFLELLRAEEGRRLRLGEHALGILAAIGPPAEAALSELREVVRGSQAAIRRWEEEIKRTQLRAIYRDAERRASDLNRAEEQARAAGDFRVLEQIFDARAALRQWKQQQINEVGSILAYMRGIYQMRRIVALTALTKIGAVGRRELVGILHDAGCSEQLRTEAAMALQASGPAAYPELVRTVRDRAVPVGLRQQAIASLSRLGDRAAGELIRGIHDDSPEVRLQAMIGLRRLQVEDPDAIPPLLDALGSDDPLARALAVRAMGSLSTSQERVAQALLGSLRSISISRWPVGGLAMPLLRRGWPQGDEMFGEDLARMREELDGRESLRRLPLSRTETGSPPGAAGVYRRLGRHADHPGGSTSDRVHRRRGDGTHRTRPTRGLHPAGGARRPMHRNPACGRRGLSIHGQRLFGGDPRAGETRDRQGRHSGQRGSGRRRGPREVRFQDSPSPGRALGRSGPRRPTTCLDHPGCDRPGVGRRGSEAPGSVRGSGRVGQEGGDRGPHQDGTPDRRRVRAGDGAAAGRRGRDSSRGRPYAGPDRPCPRRSDLGASVSDRVPRCGSSSGGGRRAGPDLGSPPP
jgi:hypothetical protein